MQVDTPQAVRPREENNFERNVDRSIAVEEMEILDPHCRTLNDFLANIIDKTRVNIDLYVNNILSENII